MDYPIPKKTWHWAKHLSMYEAHHCEVYHVYKYVQRIKEKYGINEKTDRQSQPKVNIIFKW